MANTVQNIFMYQPTHILRRVAASCNQLYPISSSLAKLLFSTILNFSAAKILEGPAFQQGDYRRENDLQMHSHRILSLISMGE